MILLRIACRKVTAFKADCRASFGIVLALALVPFLLLVGAAIDMAALVQARADLQSALDSAVLAALPQSGALRPAAAASFLAANAPKGVTLGTPSWTTNVDNSFTGQVTGTLRTSVFGLANIRALALSASSTAAPAAAAQTVCILVKNAAASSALLAGTGAVVTAPGCEIDVASGANPAATFDALSALAVAKTCVKGPGVSNNGGLVTSLATGCQTATDPFAGTLPAVGVGACSVSNQTYVGVEALNPGTYCGSFGFLGVGILNLAPGLYVFSNAKWTLGTGWIVNGTGVTFYFADSNSSIQINGGAAINVSAPASGPYAGLLMYEPAGLAPSSVSISGAVGHLLSGLVYLPSRAVTFTAMANVTADPLTLVVDRLTLDAMAWLIAPGPKTMAAAGGGAAGYLAR